jgi:nucleotide-binding universal stress UspA family protein
MTYKRIMIAVDGSQTSELAFKEAIQFAKFLNAQVCVIHALDELPAYNIGFGIDFGQYLQLARERSQEILTRMQQLAQNDTLMVETKIIESTDTPKRISERIIEAAQSWQADLLVLGTHGRQGFSRVLVGSVAEEVIRLTPVPILLVRGKET